MAWLFPGPAQSIDPITNIVRRHHIHATALQRAFKNALDKAGLKMGPDGKLYWSIADRGFAPPPDIKGYGFTTAFLQRVLPDSGAVASYSR